MHDLLIRGGLTIDGSGADPTEADVAVSDGCITEVGRDLGPARRTIDAEGRWVTPGFVDIHTHYDAQATWDPHLLPSGWHGVTTAVCGNCGVGFAPAAPERREWLIGLMEGVEDIPGTALSEGIRWDWETFPEYLDALERTPKALDLVTQAPHGAVRAFEADFNVIDPEVLQLRRPERVFDLPGGARRLLQRADGYDATIMSGEVVMDRGEPTDARPGRLLRGPQPAPAR